MKKTECEKEYQRMYNYIKAEFKDLETESENLKEKVNKLDYVLANEIYFMMKYGNITINQAVMLSALIDDERQNILN